MDEHRHLGALLRADLRGGSASPSLPDATSLSEGKCAARPSCRTPLRPSSASMPCMFSQSAVNTTDRVCQPARQAHRSWHLVLCKDHPRNERGRQHQHITTLHTSALPAPVRVLAQSRCWLRAHGR